VVIYEYGDEYDEEDENPDEAEADDDPRQRRSLPFSAPCDRLILPRVILPRETNPKMTPRIHGTPTRKGMIPTQEQTSEAMARPLV
jgi:hypothetical protein